MAFIQKEASKWFFGQYRRLRFSHQSLSAAHRQHVHQRRFCHDLRSAGNLLFYTNGATIWNNTHAVMANGTGLLGNISTTQSSIIIKQTGNANIYYVFTLDNEANPNGLRYSVVDMNLAVGMGSVTTKMYCSIPRAQSADCR